MVLNILVAAVVVATIVFMVLWYPGAVRIGRAARAANGGRHTKWWWANLLIVIAALVVLIVTSH